MATTSATRKQAPRLARPAARYWKGKVPKGVAEATQDSDEEEEDVQEENDGDVAIGGEQFAAEEGEEQEEGLSIRQEPPTVVRGMNIALKDVNISREGRVIVGGREESGRTAMEEDESEEESDEEDKARSPGHAVRRAQSSESSEEESDSESEEEKPKLQFRPVFIPKRGRITVAEKEAFAPDSEEMIRKKEQDALERKKQSHDMVAESIKRELAEKEKEELVPDVDDTDGVDPAAEFEAWRLRELGRIKQEKEQQIAREQEREEVERRRALPEEQRLKEDLEKAKKSRDEKPKGQQKFLQKYWHKGAFHQDQEILTRHDFTEATESTVDVSMLPKVMQVKNFGKRSRTKYTHLLDQDTTVSTGGFGGTAPVKAGGTMKDGAGAGCHMCGGPHLKKDCPQNTGPIHLKRDWTSKDAPGSNQDGPQHRASNHDQGSSWRDGDRDAPPRRYWGRDKDPGDERSFDQRRSFRRSRSRSRSRSPPPRAPRYEGRRRSRDREVGYDERDREKRRKFD